MSSPLVRQSRFQKTVCGLLLCALTLTAGPIPTYAFLVSHPDCSAGRVWKSTDANGNITTSIYDAAGRRVGTIDAKGEGTNYAYDENGNQTSFTDAKGNTTRSFYDLLNRRYRTLNPISTVWTGVAYQAVATESFTAYEALGRRVGQYEQAPVGDGVTPQGQLTRYVYDALDRLSDVVQPSAAHANGAVAPVVTHYGYDELGNQLTQTDAEGRTTTYAYDSIGRRLLRTLPAGQSESMVYDADGNVRFSTDFNGKTTEYQYDAVNRIRFRIPDASLNEASVEWRYTPSGQRLAMIDATGTTSYAYDDRDRLSSKATAEGTIDYTYDNAGDVASIQRETPQGARAAYGYDALNRLSTLPDVSGGQTQYGYDLNGNLSSVVLPNGVSTGYAYDALNRLQSLAHYTASNVQAPIASYSYGVYATGQRRAAQDGTGRTSLYRYDTL